jgi:hypothetical protein
MLPIYYYHLIVDLLFCTIYRCDAKFDSKCFEIFTIMIVGLL